MISNSLYSGRQDRGTRCVDCVKISSLAGIALYFGIFILKLISKQNEYNHCKAPMTLWLVVELLLMLVFVIFLILPHFSRLFQGYMVQRLFYLIIFLFLVWSIAGFVLLVVEELEDPFCIPESLESTIEVVVCGCASLGACTLISILWIGISQFNKSFHRENQTLNQFYSYVDGNLNTQANQGYELNTLNNNQNNNLRPNQNYSALGQNQNNALNLNYPTQTISTLTGPATTYFGNATVGPHSSQFNDIGIMIDRFLASNRSVVDTHAFNDQEVRLLKRLMQPSSDEEFKNKVGDRCPICMGDLMKDQLVNPSGLIYHPLCHHLFHEDCLSAWLQRKASCPVCRQGARSGMLEEIRNIPSHSQKG